MTPCQTLLPSGLSSLFLLHHKAQFLRNFNQNDKKSVSHDIRFMTEIVLTKVPPSYSSVDVVKLAA